jgi:hypothetical protein
LKKTEETIQIPNFEKKSFRQRKLGKWSRLRSRLGQMINSKEEIMARGE